MRAIIIPNDPIKEYLKKGEVVARYFNPNNIFSEIDIISPGDSDVTPGEAKDIAGTARLGIYPSGKVSVANILFLGKYLERIEDSVKPSGADVIIAHNAHIGGFIGAVLSRKHRIPLIIHLHTNLDKDVRAHLKWSDPAKKLFWLYSSIFFEKPALGNASKVIAAYKFAADYALSRGVRPDKVEEVYHRIDVERFRKERSADSGSNASPLKILCVGRVFERKNPENIIRAIRNLRASLVIIGDGPFLEKMIRLSRDIGVSDKVDFVTSVQNSAIDRYYKEADIFACVNDYGGVSKPVMEAMASSLPIVTKKPMWEEKPELVGDIALVTDGSPEGFENAFRCLSKDRDNMSRLGRLAFERVSAISGDAMEKKEADVIISVIKEGRR
jgi:glycosyltransferase involved in cell wall biosynthesis